MNKIIYIFLTIAITFSTVRAQDQLTSLEAGVISKPVEYIGTHNNQFFFVEYDSQGYGLRSEILTDNELESILIESYSLEDYQFNSYALTDGMVALVASEEIICYNIATGEFITIDASMFDTSDQPVFSEGMAYWPIGVFELLVIDLESGETDVRTHDLEFTFDRFAMNDDQTNVLPGNKVAVAYLNENQSLKGLMEYNLADGSSRELYLLDQFGRCLGPVASDNGAHIVITNNDKSEYKLLSMRNEGEMISFISQPLDFALTDRVIYANNDYAYTRTIEQVGGQIERRHHIQDMANGEVSLVVVIDEDGKRIVQVTKDGVYVSKENELTLLSTDGTEKLIFDGLSNGDTYFMRDEDFRSSPTIEGQFIANYRLDNGDRFYTLVSPDGASAPLQGQLVTYIFDEVTELEYAIKQSTEYENQFVNFESAFSPITEDESKSLQGGIFNSTDNEFVFTENQAFTRNLYDLSRAFQSYSMPSFGDVYENYTRVGDKVLASRRFINTPGKIVDFLAQSSESFTYDTQGQSIARINEIIDGSNKAKAAVSINGDSQLATIDETGIITTFIDENDPSSTALLSVDPLLQSTMDLAIGLRGSFYSGVGQLIAIGNELEEPKIVIDNFDIFSSGPVTVIEEGTTWSYMSLDRYFFIDENAEIVEAPLDAEVPAYGDGKFYFSDKYFDESTGSFVDWESSLTEVKLVSNGKAFGLIEDELAMVDLSTLETINFGPVSADLEFYEGDEMAIFYDPNTQTVSWLNDIDQMLLDETIGDEIIVGDFRTTLGDDLLFSASSASEGSELFLINSDKEQTPYDINLGVESSNPSNFVVNDNFIYFQAYTDSDGFQLYGIDIQKALSVEDKSGIISLIDVYPNPTADRITVDASIEFDTAIIYDQKGSEIRRIANNRNTIDISELSIGLYNIRFLNDGVQLGVTKVFKK